MASTTQSSNQVLEAMVWYYGKRNCFSIGFSDAAAQGGDYFRFSEIDENYSENKLVFWLDDSIAAAPTISADETLIAIPYTDGDTAIDQAAAFVTASAALNLLLSDNLAGTVQVENKFLGVVTAGDFSTAPDMTETVLQIGSGGSLGAIAQGGATITTEQSLEDIFRDDEGDVIQDQILKGAGVSGELQAAEMTTSNWESLVGNAFGDKHSEGADDLYGYGTSKLYQSSFSYAGQLVGHPKRLANSDRSADICIWKTVSNMSDINYSGSEVQVGSFSFQALPDSSKPTAINLFARGDHSLL